ncbi:MAG: class I SAM-dependent DNA methyltransferase [Mesorhizobium sp.]|nr:MAG: class I SAM-dependent DNA methyltransferase [Mesorhizobium sp.]
MQVEEFIHRWTAREGGAERANYQMFLSEFCDVIGVPRPEPSGSEREYNDYAFERAVRRRASDEIASSKRIDLYKKSCFILEAKQSRLPGAKNAIPGQGALFADEPEQLGKRSVARGWDVMMQNARKQAEEYVYLLDASHPAPPFVIACDVGNAFEIFADFTGTGRAYSQFPDRKGFRVYLDDLRRKETRELFARIWTNPASLDPAKESARVTREIAKRLAEVSKALEARGNNPEDVAQFLMRCLFTMFAEDVELLPADSFKALLNKSVTDPSHFPHRLKMLWQDMDRGSDWSGSIDAKVRHFNGGLFKSTTVFELGREEIGELLAAAEYKWTEVDPAIFGTLLEQALEPTERKKLGAHYTPRGYVQRLVEVTVMEPLRDDWQKALTKAEAAKDERDDSKAIEIVRAFHHKLCTTRVLDPACGTGNFLYVSLELMKKLEGEVLETLARLGFNESLGLERETVDPHQFLGLELNPRAAAIAELVVWIGYLQQHYRTRTGHPAEPILRAFKNINFGHREGYDAVLTWDGYPVPSIVEEDGKRMETFPNARRPHWPEAEFIVGNPPFIGNKRMRDLLSSPYVDILRKLYGDVPESIDFVMYWWDRAASLLTCINPKIRRFGLVTTNSITQNYNRRVIQAYLDGRTHVSLVFAVPDHPWTKSDRSSAAVRIAMTVAERGIEQGKLLEIEEELGLDSDSPQLRFSFKVGRISSDLAIGPEFAATKQLLANADMSHQGVTPLGEGFRLSRSEVQLLGYDINDLPSVISRYLIGRDLVQSPQERYIIDLFGFDEYSARKAYPKLFQVILEKVKPERETKNRLAYRDKFWIYAEPRARMREALGNLERYIVTCRTAKHRVFSLVDKSYLSDAKIVAIAAADSYILSVLNSRLHVNWAMRTGAWLGIGNDSNYNHSECFAKFPFPDPSDTLKQQLRDAGEELDALRKKVLAEHPDLTLTGLYNVLEKLRAGTALTEKDEDVKTRGLVLILQELHETIDRLTAEAYGWPTDLSDEQILERLVALNAERAKEEASGQVRWLRPDYQKPRFGKGTAAKTGELDLGETVVSIEAGKPVFPKDRYEQPLAVEALLSASTIPLDSASISRAFKGGGKKIEQRVAQVLLTLARYGRVTPLPDGRFASRRVA